MKEKNRKETRTKTPTLTIILSRDGRIAVCPLFNSFSLGKNQEETKDKLLLSMRMEAMDITEGVSYLPKKYLNKTLPFAQLFLNDMEAITKAIKDEKSCGITRDQKSCTVAIVKESHEAVKEKLLIAFYTKSRHEGRRIIQSQKIVFEAMSSNR